MSEISTSFQFTDLDPDSFATQLTDRLLQQLARLGQPLPDRRTLFNAVLGQSADYLQEYAEQLRHPPPPPAWWRVDWGEAALAAGIVVPDRVTVAESKVDAVCNAIRELDTAMLQVTTLHPAMDGTLELANAEGTLVTISPLHLQPSDEDARARYREAFGKVKSVGAEAAARKAVRSIPGLKDLVDGNPASNDEQPRRRPELRGSLMAPSSRSLAWNVGLILATVNIRLKQSQLLEVAAAAYGFDSWHHLSAADAPDRGRVPAQLMVRDVDNGPVTQRLYFETFWDGLPAFAKVCSARHAHEPLCAPEVDAYDYVSRVPSITATTQAARRRAAANERDTAYAVVCLEGAAPAFSDGAAADLIRAAMADPENEIDGLFKALGLDADPAARVMRRYARLGYSADRVRHVGRWAFSLSAERDGIKPQLTVERNGGVGRDREVCCVPAYKAQFQKATTGVWLLIGNYESEAEAAFPDLDDDDIRELARWAEVENQRSVRLQPRVAIGHAEHVRRVQLLAGVPDGSELRWIDAGGEAEALSPLGVDEDFEEGAQGAERAKRRLASSQVERPVQKFLDQVRGNRPQAVEPLGDGIQLNFELGGEMLEFKDAGLWLLDDLDNGRRIQLRSMYDSAVRRAEASGGRGRTALLDALRTEIARMKADHGRDRRH